MSFFRNKNRDVHHSAIAGYWYPADPHELREEIQSHLASVKDPVELQRLPAAFISPHAGYQWSGDCAAHLYRSLQGPVGKRVKRVILMAPSHSAYIGGVSTLSVRAYKTPLGEVPVDQDVVKELLKKRDFGTNPGAHTEEHSDEIQLPFLQVVLPGVWKLVDLVFQGTGPKEWESIAESILPFVDGSTLLVASSDFTHFGERFGYKPFADDIPEQLRKLDLGAVDAALSLNSETWESYKNRTGITACGSEPIGTLLTLLRRIGEMSPDVTPGFEGRLANYYRSGDLNDDFSSSVSYAAILFEPKCAPEDSAEDSIPATEHGSEELDEEEQTFLLSLARKSLTQYLLGGSVPQPEIPDHLSSERLMKERGAFVTLTQQGRLRGCIGSIPAQDPLAKAVMRHAVQAAVEDLRFPPVQPDEVEEIHIEISVLTTPSEVERPEDIVLGRDGILLERELTRGVFLPQVAPEQGWDLPTTLRHLSMKAGLPREAWKETDTKLYVFQAQIFEED